MDLPRGEVEGEDRTRDIVKKGGGVGGDNTLNQIGVRGIASFYRPP